MVLMPFIPKPIAACPYPRPLHELWDTTSIRQHTHRVHVAGMIHGRVEGLFSVPGPLAICLSGVEVDRRIHWKPLDLEKPG